LRDDTFQTQEEPSEGEVSNYSDIKDPDDDGVAVRKSQMRHNIGITLVDNIVKNVKRVIPSKIGQINNMAFG
jgi:hypothetical protein